MAFTGDSIFWVEVDKVVSNPFQPRRDFDEGRLQELADSVKMYGVLQPLTVTRREVTREDGTFYTEYELIAGERRLKASRLAGLAQVPVIIREGEQSEQEKLELAIIENLQREDLNAVDRALAFRQLADAFGLSHAQVAKKVGRSREYVSNTMRLLLLPDYMLDSLKVGDISEGHARTLLMLNDKQEEQDTVYREILMKKLSVREVERIARKIATDKVRKKKWQNTDPELIEMEKKFTESLGTRVQIAKTDYGGKISIDYFSDEDLEELLNRLKKDREAAAAEANAVATAVTYAAAERHDEEQEILEKMGEATPLATEPAHESSESAQEATMPHQETDPQPQIIEEVPREIPQAPEPTAEQSVTPQQEFNPAPAPEVQQPSPVVAEPEPQTYAPTAESPTAPEEPQSTESARVPEEPQPTESAPALEQTAEEAPAAMVQQHEPFMTLEDAKKIEKEKQEAEKASDDSKLYGIQNFSI